MAGPAPGCALSTYAAVVVALTEPSTAPTPYPADPVAAARAMEPMVRAARATMHEQRHLAPEVVAAMVELGIFRAAVQPDLDGPNYDPVTQVRVVEELSRLDGSVGWCAMIGAAASYVAGFLEPEAASRWFGRQDACLAGQLAPSGRAVAVDGGYRVSGRFRFGSGCGHATMMIAGCLVQDATGEPRRTAKGRPEMRSAIFRPEQCTVIDTWHTTGLAGTGSNDYVVEDLFVAEEDSWDPAGRMRRTEPLFRYPPLFLVPHAGVPLGIARAAIDAVLDLAGEKPLQPGAARTERAPTLRDDGQAQETVAIAEAKLYAARSFTYDLVEELWAVLLAGERVSPRLRGLYRIMMTWTHQTAKEIVLSLYDIASTSSIYRDGPIDALARDILTACQHRMVHPKLYRPAGKLLLGLDSGDPLV